MVNHDHNKPLSFDMLMCLILSSQKFHLKRIKSCGSKLPAKMTSLLLPNPNPHVISPLFSSSSVQPHYPHRKASHRIRLNANKNGSNESSSDSEKAVLKAAWYGSELLGIAASLFRPKSELESLEQSLIDEDESFRVADAIKQDFERSYFVTGNLNLRAYEEDCEFADPAGSFRGLKRFKRNCSNFGSLLEKSNMKLTKWEDLDDKSIGHWKFSCIMSFPWRPILSATGYTEYYFDAQSGRVCRHVEHWNVPKMALLKQIFRPSRWFWEKK